MKLLLVVATSVALIFSVTDLSGEGPKHGGESMLTVQIPDFRLIPTTGALGPESFVFDFFGDGPYTGLSDGRIVKWLANESRWIDFAVTTSARYSQISPSFLRKNFDCFFVSSFSFVVLTPSIVSTNFLCPIEIIDLLIRITKLPPLRNKK